MISIVNNGISVDDVSRLSVRQNEILIALVLSICAVPSVSHERWTGSHGVAEYVRVSVELYAAAHDNGAVLYTFELQKNL